MLLRHIRRKICLSNRRFSVQSEAHLVANPHSRLLQLLQETRELAAAFPVSAQKNWIERLETAVQDLITGRQPTIAVIGNQRAASLVDAWLDEISPEIESATTLALASRRLSKFSQPLTIKFNENAEQVGNQLGLPSVWLKEHDSRILQIIYEEEPSEDLVDPIFRSDIVIYVGSNEDSNGFEPLKKAILDQSFKNSTFVAVDATNTAWDSEDAVQQNIQDFLKTKFGQSPQVMLVSTGLANEGLDALQQSSNFELFQRLFMKSGVPKFKDNISEAVKRLDKDFIATTSKSTLLNVLGALERQITTNIASLKQAEKSIEELQIKKTDEKRSTYLSLTENREGQHIVPWEDIQSSTWKIKQLVQKRFPWWSLLARCDLIAADLALTIDREFLRSFQEKLGFLSGEMIALRDRLKQAVSFTLSTPPFQESVPEMGNIHSSVLENRLDQAEYSSSDESFKELINPIDRRRGQLIAAGGPVEVFQARAQALLLESISVGGGAVVVATVSHIAEYAELATNLGGGAFGLMLASWGLQRGWEKSKKQFYRDVDRVIEGLEDDLQTTTKRALERVAFRTEVAIVGQKDLIQKREVMLEELGAKIHNIKQQLQMLVLKV